MILTTARLGNCTESENYAKITTVLMINQFKKLHFVLTNLHLLYVYCNVKICSQVTVECVLVKGTFRLTI